MSSATDNDASLRTSPTGLCRKVRLLLEPEHDAQPQMPPLGALRLRAANVQQEVAKAVHPCPSLTTLERGFDQGNHKKPQVSAYALKRTHNPLVAGSSPAGPTSTKVQVRGLSRVLGLAGAHRAVTHS